MSVKRAFRWKCAPRDFDEDLREAAKAAKGQDRRNAELSDRKRISRLRRRITLPTLSFMQEEPT